MKKTTPILLSITLWAHTTPHHIPPLPPKNTNVRIIYLDQELRKCIIQGKFVTSSRFNPGHAIILYYSQTGKKLVPYFLPIRDITEIILPKTAP